MNSTVAAQEEEKDEADEAWPREINDAESSADGPDDDEEAAAADRVAAVFAVEAAAAAMGRRYSASDGGTRPIRSHRSIAAAALSCKCADNSAARRCDCRRAAC